MRQPKSMSTKPLAVRETIASRKMCVQVACFQVRQPETRHARPGAGHPRLLFRGDKNVDCRDKPGHDDEEQAM
jgi:hypothetical protein